MATTLVGMSARDATGYINTYLKQQRRAAHDALTRLTPDAIIRAENVTIDIPATLAAMGADPSVEAVAPDKGLLDRLWTARDSQETAPVPQPCAFPEIGDERARFEKVIGTLSAIRAGGVTASERDFEKACLGSIALPTDMQAYDDNRLKALQDDKTFRYGLAVRQKACPAQPVTLADHQKCQQMLQYLSDGLRGVYNLKSIPVYLVPLPAEMATRGLYVKTLRSGPAIIINSNPTYGLFKERTLLMHTALEEMRHGIDGSWYTIMTRDKRGFSDRRAMHTTYLQLNWVGAYVSHKADYQAYAHQYMERTAKHYADTVIARFNLAQHP